MKKLLELRNRLGEIQTQLRASKIEADSVPGEELEALTTKIDGLLEERGQVEKQIATLEKLDVEEERAAEKEEKVIEKETRSTTKIETPVQDLSFGETLQCIAMTGSPEGAFSFRNFETKQKAFRALELTNEKRAASGMSEKVPSDGGFLVQKDFSNDIYKRAYDTGILASRTRKISISSNSNGIKLPYVNESSRVDGSRNGGMQGYWLDEAAQKTKSKPTLGLHELNLNKLAILTYATDELLQDTTALQSWIGDMAAEEIGFKLDDAIYRGDGSGKPDGMLNSSALVTVAKESGQTADTIVYNNIVKMYSRLWARSRSSQGVAWVANQDCIPSLYALANAAGESVWLPANGLAGRPNDTLMGLPIVYIEQASTIGDLGDIMLVDLNEYLLADKAGIQSASSMHVRFNYDEMVFRWVFRVDGQPLWANALTPYKGSNTQSPFIALAERA
jgi:HK97 family phage major capsid protein